MDKNRRNKVRCVALAIAVSFLAAAGAEWLAGSHGQSTALAQKPATPKPDDVPDISPSDLDVDVPARIDDSTPPDSSALPSKPGDSGFSQLGPPPGSRPGLVGLPTINDKGPFSCRSTKHRELLARFGGTTATERAVKAALYWLAKHQSPDGSWSLEKFQKQCTDKTCTGPGSMEARSAGAAFGLLPFLAAGQTQATNGPFQRKVAAGIYWLVQHQKADGDLSADASSQMYSHGLATIALCEDYGMTKDQAVGRAAQMAVNFIAAAQNTKTGGWRYHPGEEGDTSVLGWQLAALKTAEEAGLTVKPAAFDGAKKWLDSCRAPGKFGQYSYLPEQGPTPPMSAVGILANQYLKAGRTDPAVTGGITYLLANQPDAASHNLYYWYYATQVMHNMAGKADADTDEKSWTTWNGKMSKLLVDSQSREGCATGSWDPEIPRRDAWGAQGGRIMMTSLSCLTLEIYYRHLPLYLAEKPK